MQFRRYAAVVGLVGALSMVAPAAYAAPAPQQPATTTPALRDAVLQGIQSVFPADLFQQLQPRFLPLQDNLYLVSHPALYWRAEQEMAAKALAERLAGLSPGWGTTLSEGPQGYGVYLTYRHNG
jgi:hypothetical protein